MADREMLVDLLTWLNRWAPESRAELVPLIDDLSEHFPDAALWALFSKHAGSS